VRDAGPQLRWGPGRPGRPGPHRFDPGRRRGEGWSGGAVIAAGLFQVLGARSAARDGDVLRAMDALSYALLLVGPVALMWRHRAPISTLVLSAAASIGFATFAEPRWTFAVAPAIALFSAVRLGRRRDAVIAAAVAYTAYLLVTWVGAELFRIPEQARPDPRTAVLLAAGLALTVVLGGAAKVRSEYLAEMAKVRAEQTRARAEQERRQASEERLRIARELHDVLGHHLSLINVQAGVGLHLMDNRPEQAREALAAIKTASAEALREVRAVLGVLRPDEEAAPRRPAVGLDRLAELTADAGLDVTTDIRGVRRELPAEVDRAAYRIVQEALTNVRRHAPTTSTVRVTVEYRPTDLAVTIRNGPAAVPPEAPGAPVGPPPGPPVDPLPGPLTGPAAGPLTRPPAGAPASPPTGPAARPAAGETGGAGAGPTGEGSGIVGMRARAESLDGHLSAGPTPDGGWSVSAVLPTGRRPPADAPLHPSPSEKENA
jgi:signal transduction histidine kinase